MGTDDQHTRASSRFNLSVPNADVSVLRWLEAQDNKSVSIRMIIRDYIERDGYTDAFCRPVSQGPRRGRPPVSSLDLDEMPEEGRIEDESNTGSSKRTNDARASQSRRDDEAMKDTADMVPVVEESVQKTQVSERDRATAESTEESPTWDLGSRDDVPSAGMLGSIMRD